ncbi:FAD binding domain-containing protein [Georgenia sp. H159]|uniref:FAD binding domain-containing protein n=1 Tax=Georgenia sp. H159 TaxID=3076115 RepID=UPI002D77CB7E|nr:FAD binding domain-containing protein [Georgenia sp. H159]
MSVHLLRPERTAAVSAALLEGRALAGGTDLLVQLRAGAVAGVMVDVTNLADAPAPVTSTELDGAAAVVLSAVTPLTDIAGALGDRFGALRQAVDVFASEQIRNRATLGGNLVTGSPAADTVPALVAAGALVDLTSQDGDRTVPIGDFLLGPRRVDLRPAEWVRTVTVPLPPGSSGFRKVGGRRALAISYLNLAWQWRRDEAGRLRDVRLAMGSVAPTVVRLHHAEAALEGRAPVVDAIADAAAATAEDISPIDDLRASQTYRRRAAAGLLTEVLHSTATTSQEEDR